MTTINRRRLFGSGLGALVAAVVAKVAPVEAAPTGAILGEATGTISVDVAPAMTAMDSLHSYISAIPDPVPWATPPHMEMIPTPLSQDTTAYYGGTDGGQEVLTIPEPQILASVTGDYLTIDEWAPYPVDVGNRRISARIDEGHTILVCGSREVAVYCDGREIGINLFPSVRNRPGGGEWWGSFRIDDGAWHALTVPRGVDTIKLYASGQISHLTGGDYFSVSHDDGKTWTKIPITSWTWE
jgi:hypothetical protein